MCLVVNTWIPAPPLYTSRSFAKPPPPVQTVCECVALFRGFKGDADWKVAKGMMSETNFLASLQNLEVDSITMGQVCDMKNTRTYTRMICIPVFHN